MLKIYYQYHVCDCEVIHGQRLTYQKKEHALDPIYKFMSWTVSKKPVFCHAMFIMLFTGGGVRRHTWPSKNVCGVVL